jgi:hypothetical protein
MPSLAAAFAMPLILASFAPQVSTPKQASRPPAVCGLILVFTTLGLLGWEVVQTRSAAFVFDVYDILATLVGSLLALLAFHVHFRASACVMAPGRGQTHPSEAEELMRAFLQGLPEHLRGTLEHVVLRDDAPPTDPLSLMNAVSTCRTGLGIANGRGGVPSEEDRQLYEYLGELERWMDRELGHPEGTQYAVLRRAVERLERSSEHGRGAA